MNEPIDSFIADYERDGVIFVRNLLSNEEVSAVRSEIERYCREDLSSKPDDAATMEADGVTVRNLWRLEEHCPTLRAFAEKKEVQNLIAPLVKGVPALAAIETFNKPARVGSGVPHHQDNAYFCQDPPDMLTLWIAIDAVTEANGPVFFAKGSHHSGDLPTRPSGVRGNSVGMAKVPKVPAEDVACGLLAPGDATIHHCQTIHYSGANRTDHSRLGFLLVFRGSHTETNSEMKERYAKAAAATNL